MKTLTRRSKYDTRVSFSAVDNDDIDGNNAYLIVETHRAGCACCCNQTDYTSGGQWWDGATPTDALARAMRELDRPIYDAEVAR
jgi:hypothetical protein